jgi:hypothetical protein
MTLILRQEFIEVTETGWVSMEQTVAVTPQNRVLENLVIIGLVYKFCSLKGT